MAATTTDAAQPAPPPPRRGRPPSTDVVALETAAMALFAQHGFEATTVDMIAAAVGASRRTFFRYFESKAAVLWRDFDAEVDKLRQTLAAVPADLPVMAGVRQAVVAVNHYRAEDVPGLRARMTLIGSTPELAASAAVHYDAWEQAVSEFVAARRGLPAGGLQPLAVGRATLAACRAAYDRWLVRADADLTVYLDAALAALAAGFADDTLLPDPAPPAFRRRRSRAG